MKKILVCEDEAAIRDFVVINLTRAGYDVVEADCGEAALQKYEENNGDFDVAILDVMMPGIDGFQVCKELRNRNGGIGIIMLSAKTQEMDKVTGLMLGADDYVTKPFSPSELLKSGKMIELTQVEFQIMEYFFSNPGVALDRIDILNHVWGDAYVGEDKIVDVNIRRLRMKVEDEPSNPKHIITVWGLGYKWDSGE